MSLKVDSKGSFKHTFSFFNKALDKTKWELLYKYGQMGVDALRNATPADSGKTRESWGYDVEINENEITITWTNTNIVKGWYNVAVFLQYGHGTKNGGYVKGIDYINPALKPVFEQIAEDMWGSMIRR